MVDSSGTAPAPPPDHGSSASEGSPAAPSLATSREEDGEADGDDSKRDSGGSSDRSPGQSIQRFNSLGLLPALRATRPVSFSSSLPEKTTSATQQSDSQDGQEGQDGEDTPTGSAHPHLSEQSRSRSVGEQKWRNVRAVMALYTRLRKIKRTKSNQRWMKLRTTVQLSSAISTTIQKKPPLKREDSFLKRFSTRQIPEAQETVDTGDDGDGGSSPQGGATPTRRRRRRRGPQRLPRTVVNPDENFYFYWLFLLAVCVLYNLWTLIVRQSFPELQSSASSFWITCDGFSDVVFLLDVAVQFRTGYLEQGLMVYDSKKLAGHYLRSRAFLLDIGALLPLDLLQINLGTNPILRFPRFLKVYRVYDYYYMVESRTVYPNLWRVVNLIHILLILAHWFGCFYYLLSEAEGFEGDWVYPYRQGEYATLTRKYLGSLYWSTLTLTTIGDLPTPETNADPRSTDGPQHMPRRGLKSRLLQFNSNRGYVFTIVSYLIGVFIFATIVGQVGNVITNRNANRLEFERLLDGAKTYMRHHKVPGGMKRRVLRWYDYSWSRGRIQGGGDINTALGLLPDKLKTELALHVNLSVLKKVTIFQECQPEFLHDLVLKMKAYIFTPGDLICRKGEVAREMFIIADGILEVMSETGRVLTTMKAGDFFGEIGILNLDGLNKRTADVRSVGYSELFSLSREDVLAAMKDYPEAQEILQSLGRKRLMEARNMNRPKTGTGGSGHGGGDGSGGDDSASKRIVDRLRSDVKGLKNVLRKSRRGASSRTMDESLELQPLNPESSGSHGKSVLRRMSRVRSDDADDHLSGDSHNLSGQQQPASPSEKLGAGLPLLHKLRLLKEKQDREEKGGGHRAPLLASPPPISPPAEGPCEVIGAGLPLFQRLKLLKQKEEQAATMAAASAAGPQSRGSSLSPPTTGDDSRAHSSEDESSGTRKAGSLLNRLVSLKQRDQQQTAAPSTSSVPRLSSLTSSASSDRHSDVEQALLSPVEITTPVARPEHITFLRDKLKSSVQVPPVTSPTAHTPPSTPPSVTPSAIPSLPPPPTDSVPSSQSESCETASVPSLPRPVKKQQSWSLLKKAAILSSNSKDEASECAVVSVTSTVTASAETVVSAARTAAEGGGDTSAVESVIPAPSPEVQPPTEPSVQADTVPLSSVGRPPPPGAEADPSVPHTSVPVARRAAKPSLLQIQQDTKFYTSIDDLSPEYSGLPFVKKLKILNERQKLAELERTMAAAGFLRSSSLDSGGSSVGTNMDAGLTRSHSEATAMQYVRAQQLTRKQVTASATPTSPESNETPERRNLKSILKKLSASSLFSGNNSTTGSEEKMTGQSTEETTVSSTVNNGASNQSQALTSIQSQVDMRKLMRAPTVEGYAARHSKLTKSVTFNRDTLQSPPPSPPKTPPVPTDPSPPSTVPETAVPPQRKQPPPQVSFLMSAASNQKNFLRPSLLLPPHNNSEEEYFGEIIVGIKQVIQGHLEEIQNKFQCHFQSLEAEVKRRDEIIQQLQMRIQELEQSPRHHLRQHTSSIANGGEESSSDHSDQDDQPFMRGDSVDTVLGSPERFSREWSTPVNRKRQSWEEVSCEERVELGILPPPAWPSDSISLPLGGSSEDSSNSCSSGGEEDTDDFDKGAGVSWEVQMLAREMERQEQKHQYEEEDEENLRQSEPSMVHRIIDSDNRNERRHHHMISQRTLSLDTPRSQHPVVRSQLSTNGCGLAPHSPTLRTLPPPPHQTYPSPDS